MVTFETMEIPSCGRGALSRFLTQFGCGHWTRTGPTGGVVLVFVGGAHRFRSRYMRGKGLYFLRVRWISRVPDNALVPKPVGGFSTTSSCKSSTRLPCTLGAPPTLCFTVNKGNSDLLVRLTGSPGWMVGSLGRQRSINTRSTCQREPFPPWGR